MRTATRKEHAATTKAAIALESMAEWPDLPQAPDGERVDPASSPIRAERFGFRRGDLASFSASDLRAVLAGTLNLHGQLREADGSHLGIFLAYLNPDEIVAAAYGLVPAARTARADYTTYGLIGAANAVAYPALGQKLNGLRRRARENPQAYHFAAADDLKTRIDELERLHPAVAAGVRRAFGEPQRVGPHSGVTFYSAPEDLQRPALVHAFNTLIEPAWAYAQGKTIYTPAPTQKRKA